MSEARINLGENLVVIENENGNGEAVIRNTQTGTEIALKDYVDLVGGLGDSADPVPGTSHFEAVSTDTLLNRPDWVEDDDSPFDLNGSDSVTISFSETGFDQYKILLFVEGADQMQSSGVTASDAYDTNFQDDSRTSNVGQIGDWTTPYGGEILVETRLGSGRHEFVFDTVQAFAQTGMPVAGSNNDAGDCTSITFINSGGGSISGTAEVYHR